MPPNHQRQTKIWFISKRESWLFLSKGLMVQRGLPILSTIHGSVYRQPNHQRCAVGSLDEWHSVVHACDCRRMRTVISSRICSYPVLVHTYPFKVDVSSAHRSMRLWTPLLQLPRARSRRRATIRTPFHKFSYKKIPWSALKTSP